MPERRCYALFCSAQIAESGVGSDGGSHSLEGARWNNRGVPRLALGQRIVVVVALAFVLAVIGTYVTSLGSSPAQFGWFGYAPLTRASNPLDHPDLASWEQLLVWLGLIGLWTGSALLLLPPAPGRDD